MAIARTVRKGRNRRRLNWRRLGQQLLAAAAFGAAAAGVLWLLTTPRLAITELEVRGNHIAPGHAVERLAGAALGQNIFLAGSRAIRESVETRPEVESVKVRRKLPHTLTLDVTERQPVAVIAADNGFFEIDRNSIVFHRVKAPSRALPLISLQESIKLQPGERPADKGVAAAMNCLALCNENHYRVDKLSVDHAGNVCLNMGSGFYIKLGRAEQIGEKLAIIKMTLQARPEIAQEALYIDVSCPSAPAWKPKAREPS